MSLPDGYGFVAGRSRETAVLLLAAADAAGVDQALVRSTSDGFQVPVAVIDQYNGHKDDVVPPAPQPIDLGLEKNPNDYHAEVWIPEITQAEAPAGGVEPVIPEHTASAGAAMEASVADDAAPVNVTPVATEPPAQVEKSDQTSDVPDATAAPIAPEENATTTPTTPPVDAPAPPVEGSVAPPSSDTPVQQETGIPADSTTEGPVVDTTPVPPLGQAPVSESPDGSTPATPVDPSTDAAPVDPAPVDDRTPEEIAAGEPAGNASQADWLAWAQTLPTYDPATDAELGRDALKEKFGLK
jgi:hypothetical protein